MNTCPHCNRPFPPDVIVGGVIRQRIFDYVRSRPAGVSTAQIFDHVYQLDPNGGPGTMDSISVNVWHINQRLAKQGLSMRVRATSKGAGAVYKIIELKPAIRPNTCPTPALGLDPAKRGGNAQNYAVP